MGVKFWVAQDKKRGDLSGFRLSGLRRGRAGDLSGTEEIPRRETRRGEMWKNFSST